jgi:N-acyl-D-amino-acid deacylase
VLFDAESIIDRATFADPKQSPAGIDLVLVNGEVAAEGGCATDVRAGRFLRFSK